MAIEQYPKVYLYKRIVQAKLFIDNNYAGNIDLDNIAQKSKSDKWRINTSTITCGDLILNFIIINFIGLQFLAGDYKFRHAIAALHLLQTS